MKSDLCKSTKLSRNVRVSSSREGYWSGYSRPKSRKTLVEEPLQRFPFDFVNLEIEKWIHFKALRPFLLLSFVTAASFAASFPKSHNSKLFVRRKIGIGYSANNKLIIRIDNSGE